MTQLAHDEIGSNDLPAVFRASDAAAVRAQRRYVQLVVLDLVLIVLAALSTSWAISNPELRVGLAFVGAIILFLGFALTAFIRTADHSKEWFAARAAAESSKSLAWRYITGVAPYPISLSESEADGRFVHGLKDVLVERGNIGGSVGGADASGEQITTRMRAVRGQGLEARKAFYLTSRIQDQRKWYGGKSAMNDARARRWLAGVAAAQLVGAVSAVAIIQWPDLVINLASVFAALAAAFLAWIQARQYRELAQAYGMAAHELGLIEAMHPHVATEEDLARLVSEAEGAISREHSMWTARRQPPS